MTDLVALGADALAAVRGGFARLGRLPATLGADVRRAFGPDAPSRAPRGPAAWGVLLVVLLPMTWVLAPLRFDPAGSPLLVDGVWLFVVLLPVLLLTVAGMALLRSVGPVRPAETGARLVAAVLLLPLVVFVLTISIGVGTRERPWAVWSPPEVLVGAVYALLGPLFLLLPAVLLGAVAAALWPWSGRVGRGLALLAVVVALAWAVRWVEPPPPDEAVFPLLAVAGVLLVGTAGLSLVRAWWERGRSVASVSGT